MRPTYPASDLYRTAAERRALAEAYRRVAAETRLAGRATSEGLESVETRALELEEAARRFDRDAESDEAAARAALRAETRPRPSRLRERLEEAAAPTGYRDLRRSGYSASVALELARGVELYRAGEAAGIAGVEYVGEAGAERPYRLYVLDRLASDLEPDAALELESDLEAVAFLAGEAADELREQLATREALSGYYAESALLEAGLSPAAAEEAGALLRLEPARLEESYRLDRDRDPRDVDPRLRRAARIRRARRELEDAGRARLVDRLGEGSDVEPAVTAARRAL